MIYEYIQLFGLSWIVLSSCSVVTYFIVKRPFFPERRSIDVRTQLQTGLINTLLYPAILLGTGVWHRLGHSHGPSDRVWADILFYIYSVEILYYALHRTMHTWPWLYKNVHAIHHSNSEVVPADTFHTGATDLFLTIQSVHLPVYWLPGIRRWQFVLIHLFYIIGSFWVHQKGTDHAWHHRFRSGNYSFLIPVWDVVFATFRYES